MLHFDFFAILLPMRYLQKCCGAKDKGRVWFSASFSQYNTHMPVRTRADCRPLSKPMEDIDTFIDCFNNLLS